MTRNGRFLALLLGALAVAGGLFGLATTGWGWPAVIFGALVLIGTLFDLGYHGLREAPDHARWQPTGERELDTATGEIVEVWFDPVTGERSYRRAGE
jgi:hypothetical protein